VIARTGEIGVRERDATMRLISQNIPWRRLAVQPEEESRLRIHVSVSPAIQNDSSDIVFRMES